MIRSTMNLWQTVFILIYLATQCSAVNITSDMDTDYDYDYEYDLLTSYQELPCTSSCSDSNGYFWCYTETSWDYCSISAGLDYKGRECTSACDKVGTSYNWCEVQGGLWGYCSIPEDTYWDECSSGECIEADCTDYEDGFMCSCKDGFRGSGLTCIDVDECRHGSDDCDTNADCANTLGSFTCTCRKGYVGDGVICVEEDSAEGLLTAYQELPCQGDCSNLGDYSSGAYSYWWCYTATSWDYCSISAGYDNYGRRCSSTCGHNGEKYNWCPTVDGGWGYCSITANATHACSSGSHGCDANADCAVTGGSVICTCKKGFTGDGKTCTAQAAPTGLLTSYQQLPCKGKCSKAEEDYLWCHTSTSWDYCSMSAGYDYKGRNCTSTCEKKNAKYNWCYVGEPVAGGDWGYCAITFNEDVCLSGAHGCDENAKCSETADGVTCECKPGFIGDGKTCTSMGSSAVVNSETTDCGKEYSATTGVLTSPGFPRNYPNNIASCTTIIRSSGPILIQFTSFNVEAGDGCPYDYLEIFDGETSSSQSLGKFCGAKKPSNILSTGRAVYLNFHSDSGVATGGFKLKWSPATLKECGKTHKASTGVVTSPGYPQNYPTKIASCATIIRSSGPIQLQFTSFDVEADAQCRYDYLEIFDGATSSSRSLGKFCGTNLPPKLKSTGNAIYLNFHSDDSETRKGFQLKWSPATGCGVVHRAAAGVVTSPGYPNNYANNIADCRTVIRNSKPIRLHFTSFDVEHHSLCSYDFLEIFDDATCSSRSLGRWCGKKIPADITSTGNTICLKFHSDSGVAMKGFRLEWSLKTDSTPAGAGASDFNYPGCGVKGPRTRIINGQDAEPGEWPWQVLVTAITERSGNGYRYMSCGGSILTDTIVLTAAHCVCDENTKISYADKDIFVYGGVHDTREAVRWNPPPQIQKRGIRNKVVHTSYLTSGPKVIAKDIAILRVKSKFQLNHLVNTACLPPKDNLYAGVMATATGWGRTVWYDTGSASKILKELGRYPILANADCPNKRVRAPVGQWPPSPAYEICAQDAQRGTCQGDSGGPLVVTGANNKWQVVGVVSFGWNGANCVGDGHFMRVTYFLDWIKDNAKCLNTCQTKCVNAECVR